MIASNDGTRGDGAAAIKAFISIEFFSLRDVWLAVRDVVARSPLELLFVDAPLLRGFDRSSDHLMSPAQLAVVRKLSQDALRSLCAALRLPTDGDVEQCVARIAATPQVVLAAKWTAK